MFPRVLRVETGFSTLKRTENTWWADILDYEIYLNTPRLWRRIEEMLGLDIALAFETKKVAHKYDIIWADSEKVGIPLMFMGVKKPVVVLAHYFASRKKRILIRSAGLTNKWAGIGYLSDADKDFLSTYYNVPPERLFCAASPHLERFTPSFKQTNGPIISVGVADRDYNTLVSALESLTGYETEIFVSSRYGDKFRGRIHSPIPDWVRLRSKVSDDDIVRAYQNSRFVVVPLLDTSHHTAGYSVALEASACGKAVIATNTLGISTYVIDGVTGILVPPNDIKALERSIQRLWNQPELAIQLGLAGRRFVEERFNPERTNKIVEEFLIKLHVKELGTPFFEYQS